MKKGVYCRMCGEFIMNATANRKYCDKCYRIRKHELKQKREQLDESYMEDDVAVKEERKQYGPTLEEIIAGMNKEGLQYAAYCKKHGLY